MVKKKKKLMDCAVSGGGKIHTGRGMNVRGKRGYSERGAFARGRKKAPPQFTVNRGKNRAYSRARYRLPALPIALLFSRFVRISILDYIYFVSYCFLLVTSDDKFNLIKEIMENIYAVLVLCLIFLLNKNL